MNSEGAGGPAILAQGLCKSYGTVRAVDRLDLEARRGEIYGFLGRNGAGKTTTIRMILGLARPSAGIVSLFGSGTDGNREATLARVGYFVEGSAAYPNLTVRENLELQRRLTRVPRSARGKGLYGFPFGEPRVEAPSRAAVEEAIALLGLKSCVDRKAGSLSLGNRQRLSLARALVHSPELLVLDEPANGLDPAGIVEIRGLLRRLADELGVTVFMSSHLLDEVEQLADRVGVIHEGRLVEELDRSELRGGGSLVIEVAGGDGEAAERALAEAGIRPLKVAPAAMDLERRFMSITGGVR